MNSQRNDPPDPAKTLQMVLLSLSCYERNSAIKSIEWDEVSDFLDFLSSRISARYDRCDDPDDVLGNVKHAFHELKQALEGLGDLLDPDEIRDIAESHKSDRNLGVAR